MEEQYRKLHWFVAIRRSFGQLFLAAIFGGFTVFSMAGTTPSVIVLVIAFIVLLILTVINYARFGYLIDEDSLIIASGLISTTTETIPFERLQDVNRVEDPLQRMFRIFTVQFLVSGSQTTIELPGVDENFIAELHHRLLAFEEDHELAIQVDSLKPSTDSLSKEKATAFTLRMGIVDCFRLACIRNSALALIGVVFGFLYNRFQDVFFKGLDAVIRYIYWDDIPEWEVYFNNSGRISSEYPWIVFIPNPAIDWTPLLFIALLLLALFIVAYVVASFILMFLVFYRFNLNLSDDEVSLKSGSALRVSRTAAIDKIQYTKSVRTIRHRLLGAESVYFNTSASRSGRGILQGMLSNWLVPLSSTAKSKEALRNVYSQYSLEVGGWKGVDHVGWKRRFKKHTMFCLPIFVVMFLVSPWLLVLVLGVLLFIWYESNQFVSLLGYRMSEDVIQLRRGWRVRNEFVIPLVKIQSIGLKQNLFDQGYDMVTLCVDTYNLGGSSYTIKLPYLNVDVAERLASRIRSHMVDYAYDG